MKTAVQNQNLHGKLVNFSLNDINIVRSKLKTGEEKRYIRPKLVLQKKEKFVGGNESGPRLERRGKTNFSPQQNPTHLREKIYFNFFFGRNWVVRPHFFLRQLIARWA